MTCSMARVLAVAAAALVLGAAGQPPSRETPGQMRAAAGANSLMQLYGEAQRANPGVKAAEAGLQAADYGVHDAYFGYLPRVSLVYNPQREYQRVLSTDNPVYQAGSRYFPNTGYSFQVLQPIIDFGAMARIAGAHAEERNEAAQLEAVRQKMTFDLIEAYLLALAALDSQRVAAAEEQTYAQHRDEIERRLARGVANRTELAEINARIDKARSDQIISRAGVEKAMSILQRVTTHPVSALLPMETDIPMPSPVPYNVQAWVNAANKSNPIIKAMVAQADVADAEFKRMVAESLPRLDVILSDDRLNAGGSLYGGGAVTNEQIAELRLTVPLFNADGHGYPGFAGYEKRAQARFAAQDKQQEIDQQVRAAFSDALRDSQAAVSLAAASHNHLVVRDDIQRKFAAGVAPISDVIDAERDYVRSEREMLASHYNYLIAMMELKRLTGTIGVNDVRYIDTLLDRSHAYVAMASTK